MRCKVSIGTVAIYGGLLRCKAIALLRERRRALARWRRLQTRAVRSARARRLVPQEIFNVRQLRRNEWEQTCSEHLIKEIARSCAELIDLVPIVASGTAVRRARPCRAAVRVERRACLCSSVVTLNVSDERVAFV